MYYLDRACQNLVSLFYNDKDPFDYIEKNGVINTPVLRKTAIDLYDLLIAIGTVGLIITIMYCALKYISTKNPNAKREIKSTLVHKCIVGIVLFGFVFFAGIIMKIAKSFV